MPILHVRSAFMVFHALLGSVLLFMGHNMFFHALHEHGGDPHHLAAGALAMVGAVLLFVPRTVSFGGIALLMVLVPGFLIRLYQGEWATHLLIYAAGVWFVMAHGAAWGRGGSGPGGGTAAPA
jgi:hypothetical protein